MSLTRETILHELRSRADHFRAQGIASMSLFGSVARGEADESSDIDILVRVEREFASGFAYFGLLDHVRSELTAIFDRSVDVVPEPVIKPALAAAIAKDCVVAY